MLNPSRQVAPPKDDDRPVFAKGALEELSALGLGAWDLGLGLVPNNRGIEYIQTWHVCVYVSIAQLQLRRGRER